MPDRSEHPDSNRKESSLEPPSLLIEYNPAMRDFRWKATGGIPKMELCGCLGLIQSLLYDEIKMSMLEAQRQAKAKAVQLPNGPIPPGRIIF